MNDMCEARGITARRLLPSEDWGGGVTSYTTYCTEETQGQTGLDVQDKTPERKRKRKRKYRFLEICCRRCDWGNELYHQIFLPVLHKRRTNVFLAFFLKLFVTSLLCVPEI